MPKQPAVLSSPKENLRPTHRKNATSDIVTLHKKHTPSSVDETSAASPANRIEEHGKEVRANYLKEVVTEKRREEKR